MSDEFLIAGVVILAILFGGDPDLMDAIINWLNK
jgi:hypothetical protein